MEAVDYVVECANWKCVVGFNDPIYTTEESKLLEICTLAYEELFNPSVLHKNVTLYSLLDERGLDYFDNTELNKELSEFPTFKISILTKCYKSADYKNEKKHHLITSDTLIENSSNHTLIHQFMKMKRNYYASNPKTEALIKRRFGAKQVIKNVH